MAPREVIVDARVAAARRASIGRRQEVVRIRKPGEARSSGWIRGHKVESFLRNRVGHLHEHGPRIGAHVRIDRVEAEQVTLQLP